jgi:tRNA-specific 2-thiouridylase
VKIRYHHAAAEATLHPLNGDAVEIRFDTPQPAITPGQLAVIYAGDRVLGGAHIGHPLHAVGADVTAEAGELPIIG